MESEKYKKIRLRGMPYRAGRRLHTRLKGVITCQASFVGLDKKLSSPIGLLNLLSLEYEKTVKPVISPSAKIRSLAAGKCLASEALSDGFAAKPNRILRARRAELDLIHE